MTLLGASDSPEYLNGIRDAYDTMLFVIREYCAATPRATLRVAIYLISAQRNADIRRLTGRLTDYDEGE